MDEGDTGDNGDSGDQGASGAASNSGGDPKVTKITWKTGATLPASTSKTGYFTLGTFSVNPDGTIVIANSRGIGSQAYSYCGGSHYFDPA